MSAPKNDPLLGRGDAALCQRSHAVPPRPGSALIVRGEEGKVDGQSGGAGWGCPRKQGPILAPVEEPPDKQRTQLSTASGLPLPLTFRCSPRVLMLLKGDKAELGLSDARRIRGRVFNTERKLP